MCILTINVKCFLIKYFYFIWKNIIETYCAPKYKLLHIILKTALVPSECINIEILMLENKNNKPATVAPQHPIVFRKVIGLNLRSTQCHSERRKYLFLLLLWQVLQIFRVGGMAQNSYHAQLGLSAKGRAIKGQKVVDTTCDHMYSN